MNSAKLCFSMSCFSSFLLSDDDFVGLLDEHFNVQKLML